jgi:hypothetical protein
MGMADRVVPEPTSRLASETRNLRLAAQLKGNLARRKQQSRARAHRTGSSLEGGENPPDVDNTET